MVLLWDATHTPRQRLASGRTGWPGSRDAWTATRRAAEEIEMRTAGQRGARATNEARVAQLRAIVPERRAAIAAIAAEAAAQAHPHEQARAAHATADAAHRQAEESRSARRTSYDT